VIAGVILSAIFFVAKVSHIKVKEDHTDKHMVFTVEGQLFFASVDHFLNAFDYNVNNREIIIDFSSAHIWDESAVGAIDKAILKYYENQNIVTIKGLNAASEKMVDKLAIYKKRETKLSVH